MAAAQSAPGVKLRDTALGLRILHSLILNKAAERVRGSATMPIFEYVCKECSHAFEALVYGDEKAQCPKCNSRKLAPQISVFAVAGKGGSGEMPVSGPCGACGDPRGPGACSMADDVD